MNPFEIGSSITVSAPAKAVLCGEYAVLNGAPAACLALNRRVRVAIRPTTEPHSSIAAPGYIEQRFRFRNSADGQVEWLDRQDSDTHRLFSAVWAEADGPPSRELSITIDSRAFYDDETQRKLGIGSSAATATALAAALSIEASNPDAAVLTIAKAAHAEFQHGRGSGMDVAASFHGGVILFEDGRTVRQLEWPHGLSYRLFWSGREAATGEKLARLERSGSGTGDELARRSKSAILAIDTGSAATALDALSCYVEALENFDRAHDVGIFTAGHDALVAAARAQRNCIYKPCGAGGGDIGLAVAQGEEGLNELCEAAQSLGFRALDIEIDPHGVRREIVQ